MLSVKIKKSGDRPCDQLPAAMSEGASGMDLCASLDQDLVLKPLQRGLVPCGFALEIPLGYEAQVRPRSGLAIKHGISCLNSPGTIDSDYRGEIKVILINLGQEDFLIKNGDRIAQMVFHKIEQVDWQVVEAIAETKRGQGGFGSTGL